MHKINATDLCLSFSEQLIALAVTDLHDLSLRQIAVLALCLRPGTPKTIRGMASVLGIPKPSVSRAVDRLEFAGYALRRKDPEDGRSVLVTATEAGQLFIGLASKSD